MAPAAKSPHIAVRIGVYVFLCYVTLVVFGSLRLARLAPLVTGRVEAIGVVERQRLAVRAQGPVLALPRDQQARI